MSLEVQVVSMSPSESTDASESEILLSRLQDLAPHETKAQEEIKQLLKLPHVAGCRTPTPPLLPAERVLLALASNSRVEGVFYMMPIKLKGSFPVYVRYFEFGCYEGFLEADGKRILNDPSAHFMTIFTAWDVRAESSIRKRKTKSHHTELDGHNLSNLTSGNKSKSLSLGFMRAFSILQQKDAVDMFLVCVKQKTKRKQQLGSLVWSSGLQSELWTESLDQYALTPHLPSSLLSPSCLQDPFLDPRRLLASIPNWPNWSRPSTSGVKWYEYFARTGASPRSKLLSALTSSSRLHQLHVAQKVLDAWRGDKFRLPNVVKRQYFGRVVKARRPLSRLPECLLKVPPELPAEILADDDEINNEIAQVEPPTEKNMEVTVEGLYGRYKEELLSKGVLLWRRSGYDSTCIVFTDLDSKGLVHCSMSGDEHTCECDVWRGLQMSVLLASRRCVHLTLMAEILSLINPSLALDHMYSKPSSYPTPLHKKVTEGLIGIGQSAVKVLPHLYSVIPSSGYEVPRFVRVTTVEGNETLECSGEVCRIRKIARGTAGQSSHNLCAHLSTILANLPAQAPSGSRSTFERPVVSSDRHEATLVKACNKRQLWIDGLLQRRDGVLILTGVIFSPAQPALCSKCKSELGHPDPDTSVTVYTRHAPVLIKCSLRKCQNRHITRWNSHDQRIFRYSDKTAFAYEVFWDYCSVKQLSSMLPSAFADYMTAVYRSHLVSSAPFVNARDFHEAWSQWNMCRTDSTADHNLDPA